MKTIEVIFTNTRRDPTKLLVVNIYDKDAAIQNVYTLKKVYVDEIKHEQ